LAPLEIRNLFLEQSGDFTVMKMSAPEAIRLLKAGNIRCAIISDCLMPGTDGNDPLLQSRPSG